MRGSVICALVALKRLIVDGMVVQVGADIFNDVMEVQAFCFQKMIAKFA